MINHIRTLLLNQSARQAGLASGTPGAEYVSGDFRPLLLPAQMEDVRSAILSRSTNSYQTHCLLAYIMRLLHAPDLAPYTLKLDARTTYRFDSDFAKSLRDNFVTMTTSQSSDCTTIVQLRQRATAKLTGVGQNLHWTVQRTASMGDRVSVVYAGGNEQEYPVVFSGAYSQDFVLLPQLLAFRLRASGGLLAGSFTAQISCNLPVELHLTNTLQALEQLDRAAQMTGWVFDPWTSHEATLADLQQLWLYAPETSVRLGAIILAFAWQCERVRMGLPPPTDRLSTLRRVT